MRSNFAYLQSTGGPSFSIDKFVSISQIPKPPYNGYSFDCYDKNYDTKENYSYKYGFFAAGALVLRKWGELELI